MDENQSQMQEQMTRVKAEHQTLLDRLQAQDETSK